ncbi:MAG: single-stranded DNA-binding protein [Planctomycetes bacterium]|nr:single-stranded DNA-binding protein [Planctomycetota bacterium]
MAYFNKVLLMGNLTRDPELSYTPQGAAVCKLGLAVNNSYLTSSGERKEDPLFIDIVVWKKQAENCATFLKKGRPVFIEGRLQLDRWEKDGQKHSKMKVVANQVKFIGAKPKNDGMGGEETVREEMSSKEASPDELPDAGTDDDIPF